MTLAGFDRLDELADVAPCVLDGSLLGLTHPVFDFGKGLFDWIEVRGVWRQIPESGAGLAYGEPDGFGFVAAEIVHDDDITRDKGRRELLFDVGAEAFAVDRAIEYAWRSETVAAQRAEERQRAPVTERSEAAQALALGAPASQRRHVGLDPRLVDEDEAMRIEATLPRPPASTFVGYIVAGLLKGE